MGGLKRFVYVLYSILGLLGIVALGLTWYGPFVRQASALMGVDWYYRTVEVLMFLIGLGLVVTFFRGLLSKPRGTVEVNTVDGGHVTITHDAVASLATSIVEADGTCLADEVTVRAKRTGNIRVHVRVQPVSTMDVMRKGEELTAELKSGLAPLCGDKLRKVTLEFTEPQTEEYRPRVPETVDYAPPAVLVQDSGGEGVHEYAALPNPDDLAFGDDGEVE